MKNNLLAILILGLTTILVNTGTSSASDISFVLNDDSAYSKVWNTKYVRNLASKYSNIHLRIEDRDSAYREFYLGFDEGTHTTRYDTLKVDENGIVYRNEDRTQADEVWVVVE